MSSRSKAIVILSFICLLSTACSTAAMKTPSVTPPSEGLRIAFTSDRDGNVDIYVMRADGSGVTNISNHGALDAYAAWSPDGTKITFGSNRSGGLELYLMNPDGSGLERLTGDAVAGNNPYAIVSNALPIWSPDGNQIAYVHNHIAGEIYLINIDKPWNGINLTNNPADDRDPAWSPDGSKIVFTSDREDEDYELYVMNADGSDVNRLTNSSKTDWNPSWSPDGTKIAFTSARDAVEPDPYRTEIYVMNADGSGVTRLTNNEAWEYNPVWSPDGTKIAFATTLDGNKEIYVMNADGSGQINLTNNPASDEFPTWSPP